MAVIQINLNHARRAQDLLGQRMREVEADIAIVSEPWWVPPGDEKWLSSLGGSPLAAILVSKGGGTCSLVRRGLFFVAAKWGDSLVVSVYFPPSEDISKYCRLLDELEELLGSFSTLPALVAGDFNARSHRWDPEGRSSLRGDLLCMWANRSNLSLGNQDTRAVDEDRLAAALVSADWTRNHSASGEDLVRWLNNSLTSACDIGMSRVITGVNRGRVVPWWSQKIAALRREAMLSRRRYQRARRSDDLARMRECLYSSREAKRGLVRAIRRAKASAWRDFLTTIEEDPWGRPYRLVLNKLRARGLPPLTEALDPSLLAEIVSELFPGDGRPVSPNTEVADPAVIRVSEEEVYRAAARIGLERAPGPDGVPGLVLKRAATFCNKGLADCFSVLLRNGVFPCAWKRARLVLVKKKSKNHDDSLSSFRPICLLDEVGKLFERVIVSRAPLRGLNSKSAGDPSVHWEDPSEPSRTEGKEATPLQQRDPLRAPLWCSGVVARCCGRSEGQAGCSGPAKKGSNQGVLRV
ncbi:uncharacterized protein LOC122522703 [Polistes fuscatus]|uniref:uncharacterized protein LOC122522703 n=1 Tax=Polistes fuscatus TaxID=30207 RepID=UPI001CA84057|nr:uncharacterized protein LOC122522703 [Polistes fuscatus]